MDPKLLESAEFYQRRYKNFSTMIIVPILLIFILVIGFSLFGQKEIAVKATGELQPTKVIGTIQSTSGNPIVINNLAENKVVKKGTVLLTYNAKNAVSETTLLHEQLSNLQQQLAEIKLLQQGMKENVNPFVKPDKFGYMNLLDDYLAQVKLLKSAQSQGDKQTDKDNHSSAKVKNTVSEQLKTYQAKIVDYRQLLKSIKGGKNVLASDSSLKTNYRLYRQQLRNAASKDRVGLKAENVSTVQQQIAQLQDTKASYQVQMAGITGAPDKTTDLGAKLASLKAEQLLATSKEQTNLQSNLEELQAKIKIQRNENQQNSVIAPANGIIHENEQVKGQQMIPTGSVIAQLYPVLKDQTKINIVTYISVADIVNLKKAQTMRLSLYQALPKPLILRGRIESIASAPTATAKGNVFKVVATTQIKNAQLRHLRYGLEGKVVVITGKKTFFDYYKDKLLNN